MKRLLNMIRKNLNLYFALIFFLTLFFLADSTRCYAAESEPETETEDAVGTAVSFNLTLDSYIPQKDHYNFYFTYKNVHPWWDAVAIGIEDAQRQFLEKGITITYEYMAPVTASAEDQKKRL